MLFLAYLALFGIPLWAAIFILTRRGSATAVAIAVVGGWLAMPLLKIEPPGLPLMDKAGLLGLSVVISTWIAKSRNGSRLRPRWFDLPMAAWCLVPLAAHFSNDLALYYGASAVMRQTLVWAAPYAIGRMICVGRKEIADVGRILLLGAVAYVPLCLVESRMAPQTHNWIYGMPGRANWEVVAFYGPLKWKASVFLESPLELTSLMGVGFLFGWWMWYRGRIKKVAGYPMHVLLPMALLSTLMGKSLGGVSLTIGTACVLWLGFRFRTRAFLIAMMVVAPAYIQTRTTGLWSGQELVQFIDENVSSRRAESLEVRMINEDMLVTRALERPVLGWGGWGRNRIRAEDGRDVTLTDGLWVIILGLDGVVGVVLWLVVLFLPVALVLFRLRSMHDWVDPGNAVLLFGCVVLVLHSIDCLANAMPNPIYPMIAGGVTSAIRTNKLLATSPLRRVTPVRFGLRPSTGTSFVMPR